MKRRVGSAVILSVTIVVLALVASAIHPASVQTQANRLPRTTDGKPNLTGVWQSMTQANWDIQAHESKAGPVISLGAAFAVQGGPGIVDGNDIPYLPAAAKKKTENAANWMTLDPEVKCYMPGVPRANYQPFPFQIVQSPQNIIIAYEFASASRVVRMNSKEESPAPAWMGWSIGRWDGDTLVVEVTDNDERTWFDRAGNHHSGDMKVTERYTMADPNVINYEATIEDAKTFSRPWKMSFPLYRHLEKNAQLVEYKCVPFVEELMYGHLRKKPTP